ncbi:MAG: glycosyltransferase family 2 protein, partial [Alphaproteobacteria bacterium]|nr:glycosyltransferase family 2 protein [Alphaproteobacteria bacterium]
MRAPGEGGNGLLEARHIRAAGCPSADDVPDHAEIAGERGIEPLPGMGPQMDHGHALRRPRRVIERLASNNRGAGTRSRRPYGPGAAPFAPPRGATYSVPPLDGPDSAPVRSGPEAARPGAAHAAPLTLSVIIPAFDEAENIDPLFAQLEPVLQQLASLAEVIFVDDGSRDDTAERVRRLAATRPHVKLIRLGRNFGQTAALMAGFDHASGEIIVALDADGQNDPADIPRLLAKLGEGFDLVSGWRRVRRDPVVRVAASRLANIVISRLSGVRLRDYGCTLKAYRRSMLKGVRLYGELHRFIPIFTAWQGGRVTELAVNHRPRSHGRSKYGLDRTLSVILDLILIRFLSLYVSKPLRLFGSLGMLMLLGAALAGAYAIWLKFAEGVPFISTPLPLLVVMLVTL